MNELKVTVSVDLSAETKSFLTNLFGSAPAKADKPGAKADKPAAKETAGPTTEEVREKATAKSEAGLKDEVKALIKKHGGNNLKTLPAENYVAFLADLDELKADEEI